MYLERLEVQGFKSFANPTELVFNRELTSIVGPNGSGKSNLTDAVRWVLGEQSNKLLRGKKSEDVIFAGSDKKGRLGFAKVDLYLNNQDRLADVDYEHIIITRRVDRKGESEYLINNNKVRLLDIQLLLAKANFGQKTYSVIGQGMIDAILTSSSTERKEFFDEATGVRQFQIKKEQSINKLNSTKNNLEQSSQILAELEPRLRSLTRQVNKLDKREKLSEILKQLQTEYYSFLSNNLNKEIDENQKKFDNAQKQVSDVNQQLVELQTQLEKNEGTSSRQESFASLQAKLAQLQKELSSLLKEKTILEGKSDLKLMASGQSDVVWLNKMIEDLQNQIDKNGLLLNEKQKKLRETKNEAEFLNEKQKIILTDFKRIEQKLIKSGDPDLSNDEVAKVLDNILKQQQKFQYNFESVKDLEGLSALKKSCLQITELVKALWHKFKESKESSKSNLNQEFTRLLAKRDDLATEINSAYTKRALLENDIMKIEMQLKEDKTELSSLETNKKSLDDKSANGKFMKDELSSVEEQIKDKNKEIDGVQEQVQLFNRREEDKKQFLVKAQKQFREAQNNFNVKNSELNDLKVIKARLETRQEDLNTEIQEEISDLQLIKVNKVDLDEARQKINNTKNQLNIIGGIDKVVVDEYKEVKERYDFLKEQTDDLDEAIEHLEKVIKDLDESISTQFDKSFRNINKLFDKYFKKLFDGGKAELILNIIETEEPKIDEVDSVPEEEEIKPKKTLKRSYGIDIKAVPPGKKLASINMLSGGEKALTSIALICAIIANNPSPFVVLDEVDAALDEQNSVRFVKILDELSPKTQFIAITHNRATMHKSKIIYGVTMNNDGISKLLSISFDEADDVAKH